MIEIHEREFTSGVLGNTRTVWVQPPPHPPRGICVFLDGEYYFSQVRAAKILDSLMADRTIQSLVAAYVSVVDYDIRWPESFCNEHFATFVTAELIPWLFEITDAPDDGVRVLCGLSLTGLAAAHVALQCPGAIDYALCQSGSFWWDDCRLPREAAGMAPSGTRFRLTVGTEETQENVDHGKGLVQVASQVEGCERMRDALTESGHAVSYDTFDGGHQVPAWRDDLPRSLIAMFDGS